MFCVEHEVRDTKGQEESERRLRARPYAAPRLHVYGAMTSLTCNGTSPHDENCGEGDPDSGNMPPPGCD